jgi:Tol biopolymer transport system component/predicted Ser/Thr protein kinase
MIGKTISHYRIVEKLGEGGMGVVYKALDLKLERLVALKFLPHDISIGDEDKARFLQEAKAASAISHPNVCVIHDIAESDGQQFIVMEFVDGKTLRQMVPIPKVQDALGYAIQIGEALEEAHGKGIVHRDVKTDNIMVNAANQVKVMDFGLAKLRGSLKLTKTSSTVGTLSYMAPEQIQGGEVDARSDIFSFGVVLYEILTGQLPFIGEHEAAMMYSIVNESPQPIQKFRPDLSSEVLHIINRALEKDPEERYQTMRDMVIDLRRAKKETSRVSPATLGRPVSETARPVGMEGTRRPSEQEPWEGQQPPPERKASEHRAATWRRKAYPWIVLAVVLMVAAAIAKLVIAPRRQPNLNPDMSFRTLEVPFAQIGALGLSRDGSWTAFAVRDESDLWSVYFMNVAKGDPRRLTAERYGRIYAAEISPDGSEVLYDGNLPGKPSGVYIVSSLGGSSRRIAEPGICPRWRPDGQLIGYIRSGRYFAPTESKKREFWTVRPDGSENRIAFVDSLSDPFTSVDFDWSPNGKSIAWLRGYPDHSEIFIHDLKSGTERQLTHLGTVFAAGVAWAPNDRIFFSSAKGGSTNIWMMPANGGEAIQVTKGTGPDYDARISGDARKLLYSQYREIHQIWTVNADGSNARQLTFGNQSLGGPCFSPDKQRIAFHMNSDEVLHPTCHVFTMDSDGSNRVQLTSGDDYYFCPAWSPDGKYMAYCSCGFRDPVDSARVLVVDGANPGAPRRLGKGVIPLWIDNEELSASFARPHPHSILYSIHRKEPIEVSQDSTLRFPLHDGRHILVCDIRAGRKGWWLEAAGSPESAGRKLLVSEQFHTSSWPSMSLRYLLSRQENEEVWRISLPDGRRERLPDILNGLDPNDGEIQLSYDDEQIVFLKGHIDARLVLIENLFK